MRVQQTMMVAAIALSFAIGAPVANAASPSFDCAKAVAPIEQLICQNADLSALDGSLGQVYRQARARLNASDRQALTGAQRDWISARNRNCNIPDAGEPPAAADAIACLQPLYDARIAELTSIPASTVAVARAKPMTEAPATMTEANNDYQPTAPMGRAQPAIDTANTADMSAETATEIASGPAEGTISSDPGPAMRAFEESPAQVVVQAPVSANRTAAAAPHRNANPSTERPANPLNQNDNLAAASLAAPGLTPPSMASISGQPMTLGELSEGSGSMDDMVPASVTTDATTSADAPEQADLNTTSGAPQAAPVTSVSATQLPLGLSGGDQLAANSLAAPNAGADRPVAMPASLPAEAALAADPLAGFKALNLAQAINDQCNILSYDQATQMAQYFNQQHKDLTDAGQLDNDSWEMILNQTVEKLSGVDCASPQARTLVQGTYARITPPAMN